MLFCCHNYLPLIAERWHDVFLKFVIHIIIFIIVIIIMSRIELSHDPISSSVYCWIQISPPVRLKAQYWFWQNYLFPSQHMTSNSSNITLYETTLNVLQWPRKFRLLSKSSVLTSRCSINISARISYWYFSHSDSLTSSVLITDWRTHTTYIIVFIQLVTISKQSTPYQATGYPPIKDSRIWLPQQRELHVFRRLPAMRATTVTKKNLNYGNFWVALNLFSTVLSVI